MGAKSKGSIDVQTVLRDWVERDLTEAARAGQLEPAFDLDDHVQRVAEVIAAGRHPIVAGESGVGKTALIHELLRHTHAGAGAPEIAGKPVLQFSIRNRMSSLAKADQIRPAMQQLVTVLIALGGGIVPYFRDIDQVYALDLEPQLQLLALRFPGVILAEGEGRAVETLLEQTPELDRHFLLVKLNEPDLAGMPGLLRQWADHQASRGKRYDADALGVALELSHRFLSRTRLPRKAIDFLAQVGSVVSAERAVSELDVIDRFHVAYKIPRLLIDPRVPFDPVLTAREYSTRVLEQSEAVSAVVRMISMIKAGLSDSRRPFGAFLFVGPTGVGKTHIAQLLAEHLFGSRERLVRLNMADYPDERDADVVFGNPSGYAVRQRRGELTLRLLGHPFAVLLLDELEKAHPKVHDRLLQLIDEGVFVNGALETISCRSVIIIATSNAGAEVYRAPAIGFGPSLGAATQDRELDRRLLNHFRLEFLNRFDQIVHFHPLTRAGIRAIALREVQAIGSRAGLTSRQISLEVDEAVLDWLAAHGHDPQYGARFLRRVIEREVTTAIADLLVTAAMPRGARVELVVRGGHIAARAAEDLPPSDERETVHLPMGTVERTRTLDRAGLIEEARKLIERAAPRRAALEARREEARALLEQLNRPDFWQDHGEARRLLDSYRELDLLNQIEGRLAGSIERIEDLLSRDVPQRALAGAVESGARALAEWQRRLLEQGHARAWLVIRNVDALSPADEFIRQLAELELDWCRRLHLEAEVTAFADPETVLNRVVLEVEGPGTLGYLAMESGVHRLCRSDGRDVRALVELLPQQEREADTARVSSLKRRRTFLDTSAGWYGRVERPGTGQLVELCGRDREGLARLLADLAASEPTGLDEVARLYAHDGAGARDPRTRAVIPRFKDAMAGKLDALLSAWQARLEAGE